MGHTKFPSIFPMNWYELRQSLILTTSNNLISLLKTSLTWYKFFRISYLFNISNVLII
jgi:hypothetical protein